jgi:hypothetical protein
MNRTPLYATTLLAFACAPGAAQTCQPVWETALGSPGIAQGYIQPMTPWNDGSGEKLYVGGSFAGIGGTPYRYLAAWDPTTATWSNLGRGIIQENTTFLTAIMPFDPGAGEQLVVAGAFGSAGGAPDTKSIAMWDGARWSNLGAQLRSNTADSVWSMTQWNGSLYVGGKFPDIGGVVANGIASWDGTAWSPLGTGAFGIFNPFVTSMIVFDDGSGECLYAAGRFDGIGGASAPLIARWDGTAWSRVGSGLFPTSQLFGLEAMTIFDDGSGPALFVAGFAFTPSGQPTTNVAKWDGSTWTSVGPQLGTGRLTSMVVYDDGSSPALVVGGSAMPGINYLARLENGTWLPLDGGAGGPAVPNSNFPSVFGLSTWNNDLYVGGNFTQVGISTGALLSANGIATHTSCATCYADCDTSTGTGTLDIFDFLCFQNAFVANDPYACDCDTTTGTRVCDIFDFLCFQNAFVAGCN